MSGKFGLSFVIAMLMAACLAEAGVRDLRNKYRSMAGQEGSSVSSSASAAAAASAGPGGVSSSAAASYNGRQQHFYRHPQHQQQHQQQPIHYYQPPPPPPPPQQQQQFVRQPVFRQPAPQMRVPAYYGDEGGMIDNMAQYAYQQPQYHQFVPPPPPQQRRQQQRFVKSNRGPAAATSSAAVAGHHGVGSAAAAASASAGAAYYAPSQDYDGAEVEEYNEQYAPEEENHYEAAAGTYANPNGGSFEQGGYMRDTESMESHEDGREDGDHYYNAQSYGKSGDVNKYMAFNDKDEDIIHTPGFYRKKKSKTNFLSNFTKQHRETGSGVVAHDKHSAMYNKNHKKLKENVNQQFVKGADGLIHVQNLNSKADVDDEDEEAMDTRNLGNFVGADGVLHKKRPSMGKQGATAAAAAAAAAAFQQAGR